MSLPQLSLLCFTLAFMSGCSAESAQPTLPNDIVLYPPDDGYAATVAEVPGLDGYHTVTIVKGDVFLLRGTVFNGGWHGNKTITNGKLTVSEHWCEGKILSSVGTIGATTVSVVEYRNGSPIVSYNYNESGTVTSVFDFDENGRAHARSKK